MMEPSFKDEGAGPELQPFKKRLDRKCIPIMLWNDLEQPYYKTHVIGHFAIKPLIYVLSTLLVVSVMNDVVQVAITETLRA